MNHNKLYKSILRGDKSAAEELIRRYKEKGYRINPNTGRKKTLFQLIVRKDLTDIALYFMAHGAEINTQDSLGNTPLHEAAINGNKILVEKLLKKGANPFMCNTHGMTAGMLAEHNNHPKLALRLHSSFIFHYPNLFFSSNYIPEEVKSQDVPLDLSLNRPLDLTKNSPIKSFAH